MNRLNIGQILISIIILLILCILLIRNIQYDNFQNINEFNLDDYIYNEFIIWTMTSEGYSDITYNLYKSLEKANVPWKLLNICVDDESYNYFKDKNIPCIKYNSNINTSKGEISKFGSNEFMSFNRIKLDLLDYFSKNASDNIKYVVYLDGDIVVFKDFIPYLQNLYKNNPNNYFYFQCDDENKANVNQCVNYCTGFLSFKRENIYTSPFKVYDEEKWEKTREDQPWVNAHIKEYSIPALSLEQDLFSNGTYIKNNLSKITNESKIDKYILHYNWLIGDDKINKMKENNNWFI